MSANVNDIQFQLLDDVQDVIGELDIHEFKNFPLAITYSIKDVRDLDNSKGSFSKTFNIPATKKNNKVLRNIFGEGVQITGLDLMPCAIFVSGAEIFRGRCSIKSVAKKSLPEFYEVQILGSNQDWVSKLADLHMCDLDFDDATVAQILPSITQSTTQIYDQEGIENTWAYTSDTGFIVYPLINTGKWTEENKVTPPDLFPAWFIVNLVKLCLAKIGYTLDSEFMSSDWFKKQIVFFDRQEFKLEPDTVAEYSFEVSQGSKGADTPSPWSKPQYGPCAGYPNPLVDDDTDDDCTYFEGGVRFSTIVADPESAVDLTETVTIPNFYIDTLEEWTGAGTGMFLGWSWWGRRGWDIVVSNDNNSDDRGKNFSDIRCDDFMDGPAGFQLQSQYWKFRYYPFSSSACYWPEPLYADGTTFADQGLPESQLELQPNWNPSATNNDNGYWNWDGMNMCNTTVWTCSQVGLYNFKGNQRLEANIHSIWRWNRSYSSGDPTQYPIGLYPDREQDEGNGWEYTVPCWEPSLYWRANTMPEWNWEGYGSNIVTWPLWNIYLWSNVMDHGSMMKGSTISSWSTGVDFMYTHKDEPHRPNFYNPSSTRCGGKPRCYIATWPASGDYGAASGCNGIPGPGCGVYEQGYLFNPYDPWNQNLFSSNPADGYISQNQTIDELGQGFTGPNPIRALPDVDGATMDYYQWGQNMCPMIAKEGGTFPSGGGGPGNYLPWNAIGEQMGNPEQRAMIVPCYWNFKRHFTTYRANLFLCHQKASDPWDWGQKFQVRMVGSTVRDNNGWGWCMCNDELCNAAGPYFNPHDNSVYDSATNMHGCAEDCWFGDQVAFGSPDWSTNCQTNPYASPASAMSATRLVREGYRASQTVDGPSAATKEFCCDGTGDPYDVVANPTTNPVVCQPRIPVTGYPLGEWSDVIPYWDWDGVSTMAYWGDPSTTTPTANDACRTPKERGIHNLLYANYSIYWDGDANVSEDPSGYYDPSGTNEGLIFDISWGQVATDPFQLAMEVGDKVFLYSEVIEELWSFGTQPDGHGTVMGSQARFQTYGPNISGPDPYWIAILNNNSRNMLSWCCGDISGGTNRWIGPAFECFPTTCTDNNAGDAGYCQSDNITNECNDSWGDSVPYSTSGVYDISTMHNVHYGIAAMSVNRTQFPNDCTSDCDDPDELSQGGYHTGISITNQMEPIRQVIKKTSFRSTGPSTWAGELSNIIFVGTEFPIGDVLPCAETMLEFINGLTGLYNLYWAADQGNKSIKVEPYSAFYGEVGDAVDWTPKVDYSQEQRSIFSNDFLSRYLCFTYKEDSSDNLAVETHARLDVDSCHYLSFQKTLKETFVNQEQLLGTNYYAPTVMAFDKTIATQIDAVNCPWIPFIQKEYNDLLNINDSDSYPDKMDKWRARTFQYAGLVPVNRNSPLDPSNRWNWCFLQLPQYPLACVFDIEGADTFPTLEVGNQTFANTTLAYHNQLANFDGAPPYPLTDLASTNCIGLYQMFWERQIEALITRPKLKQIWIRLNARDIAELNMSRLIYIRANEADTYWVINKITDYKPHTNELTQVELLEFVNYTPPNTGGGGQVGLSEGAALIQMQGWNKVQASGYWEKNQSANQLKTKSSFIPPPNKPSGGQDSVPRHLGLGYTDKRTQIQAERYNTKGKRNVILGTGKVDKNKGVISIGQELQNTQSDQIVLGKGNKYENTKTNADMVVKSDGKNVLNIQDGTIQSYGGEILVTEPTTGHFVKLYTEKINYRTQRVYKNTDARTIQCFLNEGRDIYDGMAK